MPPLYIVYVSNAADAKQLCKQIALPSRLRCMNILCILTIETEFRAWLGTLKEIGLVVQRVSSLVKSVRSFVISECVENPR